MLCLIISVLAIFIDTRIINLPFAILPGLAALIFYFSGYALKSLGRVRVIKPKYAILLILIWMLSTFIPTKPLGLVTCSYPLYPLTVLGRICGTLSIYIIIEIIHKHLDKKIVWMPLI